MNYILKLSGKISKIIVFLICLSGFSGMAQTKDSTGMIADNIIQFDADQLGNIYYSNAKNVFQKYDKATKRTLTYTNSRNGKLGAFDIGNPMQIYLYYPDFFNIRVLDNRLAEISTYDIRESFPTANIKLICSSNNKGFWMYDETERKLLKIGENFAMEQESSDIFSLTGKDVVPVCMLEKGDELFMSDPAIGVIVFDLFGSSKKIIPIKGVNRFYIEKDVLYYFANSKIMGYNLKTRSEEMKTFFTDKEVVDARSYLQKNIVIKNGNLYLR